MNWETVPLGGSPGASYALRLRRFGTPGARPKVYVQGGLHADEMPGVLTAHQLCTLLEGVEVRGEVVVLPLANPLGLAQRVLGGSIGRFSLADGANFNRHYPRLWDAAGDAVAGRLGADAGTNAALLRAALRDAAEALPAATPADHLRRALLRLAVDADAVLDLHCDGEAVVHLYTLTPLVEAAWPLARLLGAEAVLLADESGDDPFDEACSRPWSELRQRFPGHPLGPGCMAVTVELRGVADVNQAMAAEDARALLGALIRMGAVAGPPPELPPARCQPTPLAGVDALEAPVDGVVSYTRQPGERIEAGEVVAELIGPADGAMVPVRAAASGVLFGRAVARYAPAGRRLGKIAGAEVRREGRLLSP